MESEMNSYESKTKSISESESGDRKRKKSKNQQPNPTTSKRYQLMSELRKNMREALQFTDNNTILARFILELRKVATGRSTRYRENIQITERPWEGVVYEMIHQRHRHQRENLCNKNKPEDEKKRKRRNRSKTIVNLKELKDPLIEKFKDEELLPIVSDNGYHSPEFSEDDDGQNIIVVRNLRWRSSTLRRFLYYVDKNTKKGIKKREQVYKPSESVDEIAPSDAPGWAKSGYDGPLKRPVAKV
ncbi:12889_t:CDS:2, partial [Rhizophagus irregularis]